MKMENRSVKNGRWRYHFILLALMSIFFAACKEDNDEQLENYDPSRPVVLSDFTPKKGGLATRMVLYGENFGSDPSRIKVMIGGQTAKVIGVKNNSLHCIVPAKAYDGYIDVIILDESGQEISNVTSTESFDYQKKMLVSTFLGDYVERESDRVIKDGPFGDCGSFRNMRWLTMDPQDNNKMYVASQTGGTRLIDFEKEYVSTFTTNIDNVASVCWTLDGDMIVTRDQASDSGIGTYMFSRSSGFTSRSDVTTGRGVKASSIHPVNGEMYFTRFRAGDIQRYDFETGILETNFQNPYGGVHFIMIIHPTGDYAYLVESERHYIMRSDYDWDNKRFKIPYLVCGSAGNAGYADGVGSSARLDWPMQGTFVKNPSYSELDEDQYDFYFCDRENHAIRILNPKGRVETFAGRGNNGTWGYNDGDLRLEARLNKPESIVYDEERNCFYVGDTNNFLIRKIAYEE